VRQSSVLTVKRALEALVAGEAEFADALVRRGLPEEENTAREYAYILPNLPRDMEDLTQQGGKHETYLAPIAIASKVIGNTQDVYDDVEERIEQLVAVVIDAIEADRELGGACLDATAEQIIGPITQPTEDGWISHATIDVRIESRL
jgi:hypothetical protein